MQVWSRTKTTVLFSSLCGIADTGISQRIITVALYSIQNILP